MALPKDASAAPLAAQSEPEIQPPPPNTWDAPREHHTSFSHTLLQSYYMPFLVRYSRLVCLLWLVVVCVCAVFGPKYLTLTRSNFDLPSGTPSAIASAIYSAYWPTLNGFPPIFVVQTLINGNPSDSIINPTTQSVAWSLGNFTAGPEGVGVLQAVIGYWEGAPPKSCVSSDNATMVTTMTFSNDATTTSINKMMDVLVPFVLSLSTSTVSVASTGLFPLFNEMSSATTTSFALIDAVVLPLAIIILGFRLRSYRHMFVALATLACALLLAFAILVPIAAKLDINPFSPSIQMSLTTAVCFDYSLFLLTRYAEERLESCRSNEDAVFTMLEESGHVVFLSGATLFLTFCLLLFFPANLLMSVGVSCGVSIFTALLVSLTLTPALLLSARCFSYFELVPTSTKNCCCRVPRQDPATTSLLKQQASKVNDEVAPPPPTCCGYPLDRIWLRSTLFFTGRWMRWVVLAGLLVVFIPFVIVFARFQPTSDQQLIYLQDSPSLNAMHTLSNSFAVGAVDPYTLILDTRVPDSVWTQSYFTTEQGVIAEMLATESAFVSSTSFVGVSYVNGANLPLETALGFLNASAPGANETGPQFYRDKIAAVLPSSNLAASQVLVTTIVDPDAQGIVPFIEGVRQTNSEIEAAPIVPSLPTNLYLFGGYTTTLDVQTSLYDLVPLQVGLVCALVIIVTGVSFKSIGACILTLATSMERYASLPPIYPRLPSPCRTRPVPHCHDIHVTWDRFWAPRPRLSARGRARLFRQVISFTRSVIGRVLDHPAHGVFDSRRAGARLCHLAPRACGRV